MNNADYKNIFSVCRDEELLRILENSEDVEDNYSDLFGEGYRDEMGGSTRPSLRLGDPSTSLTLAPNNHVCQLSSDDVSSSEEESNDEGTDPVSHDGWISTEPSTVFYDFTAVDSGILAEGEKYSARQKQLSLRACKLSNTMTWRDVVMKRLRKSVIELRYFVK
ncbi:hypothetical protein HHI36_000606, partial [Cryptolaemus montrouzieri]